jgi:hypothetical protein
LLRERFSAALGIAAAGPLPPARRTSSGQITGLSARSAPPMRKRRPLGGSTRGKPLSARQTCDRPITMPSNRADFRRGNGREMSGTTWLLRRKKRVQSPHCIATACKMILREREWP